MHRNKLFICIPLFLLFYSLKLSAQENKIDSLAQNLSNYSLKNHSSLLFIHFDKNIYTNNDKVWFTGYLLKTLQDLKDYNTMYLSLINNQDSSVVLHQKFLIENGYVFGNMTLPDSIPSGNYRFIANANIKINDAPDLEFVQDVTIKSTTINPLVASISQFKIKDEQTGNGTVLVKVLSSDNRFISDADVIYTIGKKDKILKSARGKTSIIGELMIDYPADKITSDNNEINVFIKKNRDKRYVKYDLAINNRNDYHVKFYPESGNFISNITNKIGWEAKDSKGAALNVKAVLFADDKIADTITTNSTGMGSFIITPSLNVKYSVKLLDNGVLKGNYELPPQLNSGANIRLASALSNNELRVFIEGNANRKVHLLVHNYAEIFLSSELELKSNTAIKALLKLDSVPKGLNTITLLDSLYKPIAERIFFAHYDEINRLEINSNKMDYNTRDSVKLDLSILGKGNSQVKGLVSVSVVQQNRLSLANNNNIVDYTFLENNLDNLPVSISGVKYNDIGYLEDILLIKGWRKYKWPDEKVINLNNNRQISSYEFTGTVKKNNKPLKKPILINTIAAHNINSFTTDSAGRFSLPYNVLLTDEKTNVWLSVGENGYPINDIELKDPSTLLKSYQQKVKYNAKVTTMGSLAADNVNISSLAGIKLNEVTIKKSIDNTMSIGQFR